ncbi:SRPBCC family protein [Lysinibacillus sphaericus]|uniref:SRPBCC family protein n=1 Tax=Lysinibacillus sphaericus TaxID=1421 RepID=A0A544ULL9_LYSSH|nr:SRPBCC family protein [Lysinibacillus sp. SDF0037]
MLATIQQQQNNYVVKFNRPLSHSVDAVWAVLTENEKLQKWMNNLEIIDLRKNGTIHFNMNDGTNAYKEIAITDYAVKNILEFDWGKDTVRFELSPTSSGSILILLESISELTEHTPKDLAGWHICLDMLSDLLNGTAHDEFPMEEWHNRFAEYTQLVDDVEKI